MHRTFFHVAPRYTPGSPAQVSEAIAEQVAREERAASSGADLQGIAYATFEDRRGMNVRDLLTGEWFHVPLWSWVGGHWYARTDRDTFRTAVSDPLP